MFGQSTTSLSWGNRSYNGRNGKVVLLSVLEQGKHIITDDNTLLSRQNVLDTHVELLLSGAIGCGPRGNEDDQRVFLMRVKV